MLKLVVALRYLRLKQGRGEVLSIGWRYTVLGTGWYTVLGTGWYTVLGTRWYTVLGTRQVSI